MPEFYVGMTVGSLIGLPIGALTTIVVAFIATRSKP